MIKETVGVVGCGFVGKAVFKGFAQFADVKVYDINSKLSTHSFEDVVSSNFVFVCLPTPMVSVEGGKCNLSIIHSFFDKVKQEELFNATTIFILKSTIPVGTTREISNKHNIKRIVHCPEFLTARSALIDFICPARIIIGGDDIFSVNKVGDLLENRFLGTPCLKMNPMESEMVKYMANCFFATKVLFFNEMRLLIDKLNLDWEKILKGVITDGRIGMSHYEVPGHDKRRGIGGLCFPKDLNALIATMKENGIDPLVLKAVWEQNKRVRKDWDWGNNSSAVSGEENASS